MITCQLDPSIITVKGLISRESSNCGQRGPDAVGYPTYRNLRMGAGGGQASLRQSQPRKFPVIQPLSKSRDAKPQLTGFIIGGTPTLTKDDKLELQNTNPERDLSGRRFLLDRKCVMLERTKTVIPPLPRDYHVHRPGNLPSFSLSKELSHSHTGRPFTLGYPESYKLNTNPAVLIPSALVLSGRNTFSVENCKLGRPKVKYPSSNVMTVKNNQKSQSYPDPIAGASRSYIHRISELSSLEGATVRQEKLKKMRKPRKTPS
nr:uncharacterized protein LOC101464475 [Maylandia zebra]